MCRVYLKSGHPTFRSDYLLWLDIWPYLYIYNIYKPLTNMSRLFQCLFIWIMSGVKGESSCVIVYILNVKRYLLLDIVNSMLYWSSIIINVHKFSNTSMYKTRESRSQWYKALHNSVIISYIEWFNISPWSCGSSSNFCIHPHYFWLLWQKQLYNTSLYVMQYS